MCRARRRTLLALLLALNGNVGAVAAASAPNFNQDIAPILFERCAACHQPGASAPQVPLTSYDAARSWAAAIKTQVVTRNMPPWPPDPLHSAPLRNDRHLDQHEIDQLVAWVDGGTPQGPPGFPLPPIQPATVAWSNPRGTPPDLVFSLPEIHIPATGEFPYVRMLIPVLLPDDRWVVGLQTLPGNASVVHHMGIAEVQLPQGVKPEDVDKAERAARMNGLPPISADWVRPAVIDTRLSGEADMFAAFTPGAGFEGFPEGSGKLLRGGGNFFINFNIHYTASGTATTDQSRIGVWLSPSVPRHQIFRVPSSGKNIIANGVQLFPDDIGSKAEGTDVAIPPIPPNADNYELVGITAYPRAVTLYDFQPHAHLRAKDFRYDVVYPDGHKVTLLSIPRYDFHWQLNYALKTPVSLPAGSKLIVTAHYDNSTSNLHLRDFAAKDPTKRCGPDKYVFFRSQNQTWDEMFSPIVQYGIEEPARISEPARKTARVGRTAPTGDGHATRDVVAVTGCLAGDSDKESRWRLRASSQPRPTESQAVSRRELAAAEFLSGSVAYDLIGTWPFAPDQHSGKPVLIKGILIPGSPRSGINVTALQPIEGRCT